MLGCINRINIKIFEADGSATKVRNVQRSGHTLSKINWPLRKAMESAAVMYQVLVSIGNM